VIGVIAKAEEIPEVEEFFELFKTPWELYRPGEKYDVIVASVDEIPDVPARVLIVYGSKASSSDASNSIAIRLHRQGMRLTYQGRPLPLYCNGLTFLENAAATSCVSTDSGAAGLHFRSPDSTVVRLGYDLFQEVGYLLSTGQPIENAHIPTLDLHIAILRDSILNAGINLFEIPPAPAGYSFIISLTHDIDFIGIRYHRFDHSMWGFLFRSTIGAARNFFRARISIKRLLKMWQAALSLPFVLMGWAKDFWDPFNWYLRVEEGLPATYFLIPFKGRAGERVPSQNASRRATAYDITDLPEWTKTLQKSGCELGVHGIDSWHDAEKGREELVRIASVTGESEIGVRMHWLLRDQNTFRVLEEAGYAYDSTAGYNDTIGYRNGTSQVFRPFSTRTLLELPMHIQDGAMFYPQKLDLSESDAWIRCGELIDNAGQFGGCLTVLWHDRSHGPERYWGDFYVRLVHKLKSVQGWFGTSRQTVNWFRKRREVSFVPVARADGNTRVCLRYSGEEISPPLKIRIHNPYGPANDADSHAATRPPFADIAWNGTNSDEFERVLGKVCEGLEGSRQSDSPVEASKFRDQRGFSSHFQS
jgi:hypothetical protein